MTYNKAMESSRRGFFIFFFFSFFYTVTVAASSAAPGQRGFPPFPPDWELQEEGFSAPDEAEEENIEQNPQNAPNLPPRDSKHIYYYRGNRTYSESQPLEVFRINCERLDENTISFVLIFNQSINPRSINQDTFFIDDNPLPENIRFSFNKKGDRIKFEVPFGEDSFEFEIRELQAFNGTLIEPVEMIIQIEEEEEGEAEAQTEGQAEDEADAQIQEQAEVKIED